MHSNASFGVGCNFGPSCCEQVDPLAAFHLRQLPPTAYLKNSKPTLIENNNRNTETPKVMPVIVLWLVSRTVVEDWGVWMLININLWIISNTDT